MNYREKLLSLLFSLDVSRTFEKADFEKTLRTRLELFKEQKLNGLLLKILALVYFNFLLKKRSDRVVIVALAFDREKGDIPMYGLQ
jgi:hypothetical protein